MKDCKMEKYLSGYDKGCYNSAKDNCDEFPPKTWSIWILRHMCHYRICLWGRGKHTYTQHHFVWQRVSQMKPIIHQTFCIVALWGNRSYFGHQLGMQQWRRREGVSVLKPTVGHLLECFRLLRVLVICKGLELIWLSGFSLSCFGSNCSHSRN